MWSSIVLAVTELIKSLLSILHKKEDQKVKEFEKKNTEEEVRRAVIIEEIQIKDEAEKLVKEVQTGDEKTKLAALEELRRRVSS